MPSRLIIEPDIESDYHYEFQSNRLFKKFKFEKIEFNSKRQAMYGIETLDSSEKSFDFGWNRTRVSTLASYQR